MGGSERSVEGQLLDSVEEAEHALLEQCRGAFAIVGEAVVSEQMSIARIQEQLCALGRLGELAGGGEVFVRWQHLFVGVHHVDLERDTLRPRTAELRRRDAAVKEQRSLRARTRLRQHWRRQHAEREAGIDDLVRQTVSRIPTALDDRVEAYGRRLL